jgi:hypothetical protein
MMSAMPPEPVVPPVPRIIDEATKRSAVVWVAFSGGPPVPAWRLWHDGRLWLVCGGLEQDLPGAADATSAAVTVRSKATQNDRLVTWLAVVAPVVPETEEWEEVVPLLHGLRLNAPDGEDQPARWAASCLVLRLTPTGRLVAPTTDPELSPPR